MKKRFILFTIMAILSVSSSIAQSLPDSTVSNSSNRTRYTAPELLSKGKLELAKIYLAQVQTLNTVLPYAAFPIKGQGTGVKNIDIPNSDYTRKKRECVSTKVEKFNSTVDESLYEIIPYSDKVDIVKGIMFLQETIDRIDRGL